MVLLPLLSSFSLQKKRSYVIQVRYVAFYESFIHRAERFIGCHDCAVRVFHKFCFFCDHSENESRRKTDTRKTGYLLIFEITSFLHPGGLQPVQQQVLPVVHDMENRIHNPVLHSGRIRWTAGHHRVHHRHQDGCPYV